MSYPAISLATATVGRYRCPQKRLQTARQPPVYPNSSPRIIAPVTPSPPSAALTPSIPVHRWIRVKAVKEGDPDAASQFRESRPALSRASDTEIAESKLSLRDAQAVIAHEYDFNKWEDLKKHIAALAQGDLVEMRIQRIEASVVNYQRVVVLRAKESQRYLPIWIGPAEADSIALKLRDVQVPRPLTHDLLDQTIVALGATVSKVVTTDIRATTFYASIVLQANGGIIERDSRPSDALGLAVRTGAPIFASEVVLEKAGVPAKGGESPDVGAHFGWDQGVVRGVPSQRATQAISTARGEARRLNHDSMGTAHLLLGILGEREGVAAKTLISLGMDLEKLVAEVEAILQPSKGLAEREPGLTPRAARVLELGGDEAGTLGHHHFGTEHILLGVLRGGQGTAADLLKGHGVTLDRARDEVKRIIAM